MPEEIPSLVHIQLEGGRVLNYELNLRRNLRVGEKIVVKTDCGYAMAEVESVHVAGKMSMVSATPVYGEEGDPDGVWELVEGRG